MRKIEPQWNDVRAEIVTTAFVASGRPDGVHDLGRLLENLNNPALGRSIELHEPAIRPLYRATAALHLEAPLLVRSHDIIFINFDGPNLTRGVSRPPMVDVPVLLMAPPFQIQGVFAVQRDVDVTSALSFASSGFFVVTETRVFDAEGASLGDGGAIVVNGAAVQMMCATRKHIAAISAVPRQANDDPETAQPRTVDRDDTRAA